MGGNTLREDLLSIIADLRAELRRLRSAYDELLADLRSVEQERDELRDMLRRLPRSEDAARYRMERDACRRELSALRRKLRRLETLFEQVLRGSAVAVPEDQEGSILRDLGSHSRAPRRLGSIGSFVILRHQNLKGSYRFWTVRPKTDRSKGRPMSDDELARRILDLVDEYRRSRLEDHSEERE